MEYLMANVLIRDLPESLHQKIKERAAKHRRSMTKEIVVLLERVLAAEENQRPAMPQPFVGSFAIDESWLTAAKQADRS
jgi:plasmid stability protein